MSRKPPLVIADSLDLSLHGGEMVALLGPNGAGKSTLMRTLAGMQQPLSGQVTLSGVDVSTLKPRQRARRLSVVLTDRPNPGLLNGYALVALGRHPYTDWTGRLSRYDEAVIRWAVDTVGAREFAERPVMQLSDGQRQKLMIARALAQESELILLDEPTAYLDLPRRAEMMHLLRHLAAETGRVILLSTHDLDLALRVADTLWLMSAGQVRTGAPEDLVLVGAFEDAFRGEGVIFDRATGAFHIERPCGRGVIVYGQGIPHTWTRRAIARAGYTNLDADARDNPLHDVLEIRLTGDEDRPIWQIYHQDTQMICYSLNDLLALIRRIDAGS